MKHRVASSSRLSMGNFGIRTVSKLGINYRLMYSDKLENSTPSIQTT